MAYQRKYMIGVVEEKIESKLLEIASTTDKLADKFDELVDFRNEVLEKATKRASRIERLTSGTVDLRDEEWWRQFSEAVGGMPNTSRYDTSLKDLEKVLKFQEDSLKQLDAIRDTLVNSTGETISVQTAKDLGLTPLLRYTGR